MKGVASLCCQATAPKYDRSDWKNGQKYSVCKLGELMKANPDYITKFKMNSCQLSKYLFYQEFTNILLKNYTMGFFEISDLSLLKWDILHTLWVSKYFGLTGCDEE